MEQQNDFTDERYDTAMPRDLSASPALKLLCSVPITAPSPPPVQPPEKKRSKEVLVVKDKSKNTPRGSHGLRRSRSFERRSLKRQSHNILQEQAKQHHSRHAVMTANHKEGQSFTCTKDKVQAVVRLAAKLRCEGVKSEVERDIDAEKLKESENTELLTVNHEENHSFTCTKDKVQAVARLASKLGCDRAKSEAEQDIDAEKHQETANTVSLKEYMELDYKEKPPLEKAKRRASVKTSEHPIVKHPAFTVARLDNSGGMEALQAKDGNKRNERLSSMLLAISVKKSWLKRRASAMGENQADMKSFSDDESLSDQEEARLAALVAERQEQIEAEMDTLVNTVLFKLSKEKAKKITKGPTIVHSSIADSDDDLENDIVEQLSKHQSLNCMKIPQKVEEKIESLVNEIDMIRCSSFVEGNGLMDPLEDLFFSTSPRSEDRRREKVKGASIYSVKDFITDSVKSTQSPNPTRGLDHWDSAAFSDGGGTGDDNTAAGILLGGYPSEASLYSYDDNTINATLSGYMEDATVDETLGTFDDTFDETLRGSLETDENETLGDYTVETIDDSLYGQENLNKTIRLLKVRAARHGISEAQLLERIQEEQRKRAYA